MRWRAATATWCAGWRGRGRRCSSATWRCWPSASGSWPSQPTGFIPNMDRAIMIISLQLPPGASLQRTDAVVRQATEIAAGGARRAVLQCVHRPQRRDLHGRDQRRPAVPGARRFRGAPPSRPDHRQGRPVAQDQAGAADPGGAGAGVHPAARARRGRGGRLLHAPAGYVGHAGRRVRAHRPGVRGRGQPHARHRQRVHHLRRRHAAGVRRRRPRQGADAARCR